MMPSALPAPIFARQHEIMTDYLRSLDAHLSDVEAGHIEEMYGVKEFADLLHIHPRHLSNTIKHVTGRSPCDIFEHRLVDVAKKLLLETNLPIAEIARRMTYDPSNFTKFFKRYVGATPKQFRENSFRENMHREEQKN
jgi:AraC-like DNA-binding protein